MTPCADAWFRAVEVRSGLAGRPIQDESANPIDRRPTRIAVLQPPGRAHHRAEADALGGRGDRRQDLPGVGHGARRGTHEVIPHEEAIPAGHLRLPGQPYEQPWVAGSRSTWARRCRTASAIIPDRPGARRRPRQARCRALGSCGPDRWCPRPARYRPAGRLAPRHH